MSEAEKLPADEDRQPTEEQLKQEEQDAEAGFSAGFAKISGTEPKKEPEEEPEPKEEEPPPEPEEEPESKAAADATAEGKGKEAEPDPWEGVPKVVRERLESLEALPNRLRNIEGHVGGLKTTLNQLSTTAKAAATKQGADSPSDEQVAAAAKDSKEWENLKEEFPEWAEGFEKQMGVMEQRILQKVPQVDPESISKAVSDKTMTHTTEQIQEFKQSIPLYVKYPTWEEDISKPEFIEWALSGGPSQEEYFEWQALDNSDPNSAAEKLNEIIRQHPNWWAEKGNIMIQGDVHQTISLMDKFTETAKAASEKPPAEESRRKKEQRLDAATTPKSAGAVPEKGVSDDEAFSRGFKRAAGR